MATKKSDIDLIISNVNNSNFGKSLSILRDSNFDKYTQVIKQEDVLKSIFERSKSKISLKETFLQNLVNLLQSLTVRGFHTYEIVSYIAGMMEKLEDDKATKKIIKESIQIFHSNYEKVLSKKQYNNVKEILFNHTDEKDVGRGVYIDYSDSGTNFFDELSSNADQKRDLKVLGLFGTGINETQDSETKKRVFTKEFNGNTINKNITNPSRKNPAFSSILVTNPDFRIGTRNSLELSTFFNTISNIELARSYPYFNATFVLPTVNRRDKKVAFNSSTINQFLFGSQKDSKTTQNYKNLSGDPVLNMNTGKINSDVIQTNLSLFTTPQTLVNLNEPIGHSINNPNELRLTSVHDSTRPFMTIKSFTINVAPTKGLISYKTGKLSITLHDRTRMADIAPFVKPDLFGAFGSEIVLEYGWSNPDENNSKENPLGAFIGNSKVIEKYSIVNSSLNIETNGTVNIELSIAMKGANEFKNTQVSSYSKDRIEKGELKGVIQEINEARANLGLKDRISALTRLFSNEETIISDKSRIDSDSKQAILELFDKFKFLFQIEDVTNEYRVEEDFGDSFKFEIIQSTNSSLKPKQFKSLMSIVSNKEEATSDSSEPEKKFFVKNEKEKLTEQNIHQEISIIVNGIKELIDLLMKIVEEDNVEEELEKQFLTNIIGGIKYVDPFFPHDVLEKINSVGDYISLGTVINSLVCSHIVSTKQYDEVQTIFYNANENAGGMSGKNLAGFLIKKSILTELFEKLLFGRKIITIESMISQILLKCVQTADNISLGISDLYQERKELKDKLKIKNPDPKKFSKAKSRKLFELYNPGETPNGDDLNNVKFKVPIINMSFDCITSEKDKNKSILRISIFDRNDMPFNQTSQIMDEIYSSAFLSSIQKIRASRLKFESGEISRRTYKDRIHAELKNLVDKKILVKKGQDYIVNPDFGKSIDRKAKIKEVYKEIFPSLTFGSQNTAIISANVSTVNDNKLNIIFMTRPDRNNINELNSRVQSDLPLNVLPTQASVELIGCPWINFSQFIYLDFGTGTTIDNKYAVTGITHNFSPGKFTTNLTLSFGDSFGQFDAGTDVIAQALKEVSSISKKKSGTESEQALDSSLQAFSISIDENYKETLKSFIRPNLTLINQTDFIYSFSNPFLRGTSLFDSITSGGQYLSNYINLSMLFENSYLPKIFKSYFELQVSTQEPKDDLLSYIDYSFNDTIDIKTSLSTTTDESFSPYRINQQSIRHPASKVYEISKNLQILVQKNSTLVLEFKDVETSILNNSRNSIDYSKFIDLASLSKPYLDEIKPEDKSFIRNRIKARNNILFKEVALPKFEKLFNSFVFLEISLVSLAHDNRVYTYLINFFGDSEILHSSVQEEDVRSTGYLNVNYVTNITQTFECEDTIKRLSDFESNILTCDMRITDNVIAFKSEKFVESITDYRNNILEAEYKSQYDLNKMEQIENFKLNLNLENDTLFLDLQESGIQEDFQARKINYVRFRNQKNQYVSMRKKDEGKYELEIFDLLALYENCFKSKSSFFEKLSIYGEQTSIGREAEKPLYQPRQLLQEGEEDVSSPLAKTYQLPILKSTLTNTSSTILNIGNIGGFRFNIEQVRSQLDKIDLLYSITDLIANVNTSSKKLKYASYIESNFRKIKGKTLNETRKIPSVSYYRRYPIQPRLFNIIEQALKFTNEDLSRLLQSPQNLTAKITSAGSEPFYSYYDARKLDTSLIRRDKRTIRHDLGFALDVSLYLDVKKLKLTVNADTTKILSLSSPSVLTSEESVNNSIIYTFLNYAKEFGVTAIGADNDYSKGEAFHLDIAALNKDIPDGKYRELIKEGIVSGSPVRAKTWGSSGGPKPVYSSEYSPKWLESIFQGHNANENN